MLLGVDLNVGQEGGKGGGGEKEKEENGRHGEDERVV